MNNAVCTPGGARLIRRNLLGEYFVIQRLSHATDRPISVSHWVGKRVHKRHLLRFFIRLRHKESEYCHSEKVILWNMWRPRQAIQIAGNGLISGGYVKIRRLKTFGWDYGVSILREEAWLGLARSYFAESRLFFGRSSNRQMSIGTVHTVDAKFRMARDRYYYTVHMYVQMNRLQKFGVEPLSNNELSGN